MNRIAATTILATILATALPACQQVPTTISPMGMPAHTTVMPGRLQHIVLVDLEDNADIPRMRAESDRLLPTIPTVKGYVCGTHVETGRANVAHDYDLAIVVQFDSVEDYRVFLEHPVHQQLVREWRSKWRRSYIVDFAP
jgi:hypothetical protein